MTDYTHGIPGNILTGQSHSPNGGLSATLHRVTIVGPEVEGVEFLRPVTPDAPAVVIVHQGGGYVALEPADPPAPGHTQYSASGAYVEMGGGSLYADAWRRLFGHEQPVHLHDRSDTWELHNLLTS